MVPLPFGFTVRLPDIGYLLVPQLVSLAPANVREYQASGEIRAPCGRVREFIPIEFRHLPGIPLQESLNVCSCPSFTMAHMEPSEQADFQGHPDHHVNWAYG